MTDDDIDFSDLPEVTDEMWENGVLQKGLKQTLSETSNTLEIDRDIIDFFKSQGRNYREKINEILRAYMQAQQTK